MCDTQIRLGTKTFYDRLHFPRGFSRCGEFSISESYLLEKYGETLSCLSTGELEPSNQEERRFVAVANDKLYAESRLEKIWMKYVQAKKPKRFHTLFGRGKTQSNPSDYHKPEDDVVAV